MARAGMKPGASIDTRCVIDSCRDIAAACAWCLVWQAAAQERGRLLRQVQALTQRLAVAVAAQGVPQGVATTSTIHKQGR